jgi:hypothetical protein
MKGHRAGCERIEDVSNVDLWTACDTDMKIWKVKFDKLLQKLKDTLSRGRNPRTIGAFIKSVDDNVGLALIRC